MTTKNINLIGVPIAKINSRKLPTVKEVLSLFFYHKAILKLKIRDSTLKTACIVEDCWNNLQIPTSGSRNIVKKITGTFTKWKYLQCNRKRKNSRAQKQKEADFEKKLQQIFDISVNNGLKNLNKKDNNNNNSCELLMSSNSQYMNNNSVGNIEKHEEEMEIDDIGMYLLTTILQ